MTYDKIEFSRTFDKPANFHVHATSPGRSFQLGSIRPGNISGWTFLPDGSNPEGYPHEDGEPSIAEIMEAFGKFWPEYLAAFDARR